MAFKAAMVVMAPDGDPQRDRATIKTQKFEQIVVVTPLFNFDLAARVCKDLVQNEGVQSLILCPGFTHDGVAKVAKAVGGGVPINVARGDVPCTMATAAILAKEGWFPPSH
jgi:hypothetical protein